MLLIIGSFRLPAENLDFARGHMLRMIEASRAEDGCMDYSYSLDVLDAGLIRVQEIRRDKEALDHHFATSHIAAWRAA